MSKFDLAILCRFQEFWDADEKCELINQKSDGSRDEIFLHEGDEIRFSKDGARFKFRVERDDLTNERVEKEDGSEERTNQRVEKEDGSEAAADTLLLAESPLKNDDIKANDKDDADSWTDLTANGGGWVGKGGLNESKDSVLSKNRDLSDANEHNDDDDEKMNEETERMDIGSDYGGDTDVDEDLAEEREPGNDAELEIDRNERHNTPEDSPKARETAEKPEPLLKAPDREFRLSSHSQTLATQSQRKERRLPSWWTELIENEEVVPKKLPKKSRKRKASFVDEDFEAKDMKQKKHSPQKRDDENAGNKSISSTTTTTTTTATSPRESKARPGQKVKSSARRSDPENGMTSEIQETNTNRSLPPLRPISDRSDRLSLPPPTREKQTQEPSSAMFSRANFGTLVLDSDEEKEPSHSERTTPSDPRKAKGNSSIKTEDASEDADFQRDDVGDVNESFDDDVGDKEEHFEIGEELNDVVKEKLSDRDSWEEMTPPSTPVRGASTPAKKTKTTPMNTNKPGPSSSSASSSARRKCQYGKDCFRKNPAHFQECSHPDDADWVEEEEEEKEEDAESRSQKPECEFGADCYR